MTSRPNILWICADDFACGISGAYGSTRARTPNIDRLAAQGLVFDRAFCNCPLSTPSRQSFWTGRYPRSIGVTLTPSPLPEDEVTLPALLRQAGYQVAAFGKTHYYAPRKHEFDVCADHAEYHEWLRHRTPPSPPPSAKVLGPWRPFHDPPAVWLNAECRPWPCYDRDMEDTFYADSAAAYLRDAPREPFFLYASLLATHSPFRFPIEFAGRFCAEEFQAPQVGPDDWEMAPAEFNALTDQNKRGIRAAYHTAVEFLDKNVGVVLDALDASGHAEDTLVLFTSDHGYLLGEHGRFEKHCCFEPAIRTALVARQAGVIDPGRRTNALVELLDLMPTLLEVAGVETPRNVQGRTLLPLLRNQTDRHREHVFVEYADNAEAAVRTERWKLIYSAGTRARRDGYTPVYSTPGPTVLLFDLENDPDELHNLVRDAGSWRILGQLVSELEAHVIRTERNREAVPPGLSGTALLAHCLLPTELPW